MTVGCKVCKQCRRCLVGPLCWGTLESQLCIYGISRNINARFLHAECLLSRRLIHSVRAPETVSETGKCIAIHEKNWIISENVTWDRQQGRQMRISSSAMYRGLSKTKNQVSEAFGNGVTKVQMPCAEVRHTATTHEVWRAWPQLRRCSSVELTSCWHPVHNWDTDS